MVAERPAELFKQTAQNYSRNYIPFRLVCSGGVRSKERTGPSDPSGQAGVPALLIRVGLIHVLDDYDLHRAAGRNQL